MLGRNHATVGAVAVLAMAPAFPTDPVILGLAATCAAGAAVIPDLDHRQASVSKVIPVLGPLLARGVSTLSGGHRNLTHTIEAGAIVTLAASAVVPRREVAAVVVGILVCFAIALLGPHLRLVSAASLAEFFVGGAAGFAVYWYDWIPLGWLPLAVGVGYGAHLAADAVTTAGIRPLVIAPKLKLRLGRVRTGGQTETTIGAVAVIALIILTYVRVAQPLIANSTLL